MALLSDATLVVEAAQSSGTRHQGWEALKFGRPVLFLQRFLDRTTAKWPARLVGDRDLTHFCAMRDFNTTGPVRPEDH